MAATRAELTAHVGGKPSVVQSCLIEQLVQLRLRLATMDRRFARTGEMTAHDSRTYLAWANSFSRVLTRLGVQGPADRPPSLADYVASRARMPPPALADEEDTEEPAAPEAADDASDGQEAP